MGGLAQRAVATADDDQVDAAVHRPGQGVGQLGGVSDWLCVDQVEPGGAQLPVHGFVVAAAPAGADIDHKCGSPVGPDVRVHGGLGAQLYRSLHAIHPLLLVIASARSRTYGCQKRRGVVRRGSSVTRPEASAKTRWPRRGPGALLLMGLPSTPDGRRPRRGSGLLRSWVRALA